MATGSVKKFENQEILMRISFLIQSFLPRNSGRADLSLSKCKNKTTPYCPSSDLQSMGKWSWRRTAFDALHAFN